MFKKALSLLLSLMLIVASLSVTVLSVSAADSSYSVVGVEALCGVEWAKSTADAGANNMMTLKTMVHTKKYIPMFLFKIRSN